MYRIECENEINNIPIHYYLVGKIWYLFSTKNIKFHRDIGNLRMTNKTEEPLNMLKSLLL